LVVIDHFFVFLLFFCCTDVQYVFLRHISYVFIIHEQPNKPSHIIQAYQNTLRNTTVEHKNMSIHEIYLENQYFNHIFHLKDTVQRVNRKRVENTSTIKIQSPAIGNAMLRRAIFGKSFFRHCFSKLFCFFKVFTCGTTEDCKRLFRQLET
jgi:hypothetical protein